MCRSFDTRQCRDGCFSPVGVDGSWFLAEMLQGNIKGEEPP